MTAKLWTPAEVAERYGLAVGTLRNWRYLGCGPKFMKIGNRVLYRDADLARWEAQQVAGDGRRSTR